MIQNERFKLIMFVLYTIFFEVLVWGLVAAAIYYLNWDGWTVVVGIIVASSQWKPWQFGLDYKDPDEGK